MRKNWPGYNSLANTGRLSQNRRQRNERHRSDEANEEGPSAVEPPRSNAEAELSMLASSPAAAYQIVMTRKEPNAMPRR